jgi:cytoskeletal protein RodZ
MANGRTKTASFGPAFLGAVVLFCAFAVAAWILFRFVAPAQTYEEKRAQDRRDKVAAINAEAEKKLYGAPQWISQAKGTVQLPIDVAMDLVVNDYQKKPVLPSQVKVDNPYPAGLQVAAAPAAPPMASPAPGAKPAAAAATSPAPGASPTPEVKK